MQRLYLHIGQPKTGTSALQAFFSKNRENLLRDGIYYPELGGDYKVDEKIHFFSGNGNAFRSIRNEICHMQLEEKQLWSNIIKKLKSQEKDILISDEGLWSANEVLYKNFIKEKFDLQVIIYLRRQDRWCEAVWNQMVKSTKYNKSCYEFAELEANLNYYSHIKMIANIVGNENITIRSYDDIKDLGNGIFHDFMGILGIGDISMYCFDKWQANPSLSANMVEIKRIFNTLDGSNLLDEEVREVLNKSKDFFATNNMVRNAPQFLTVEERRGLLLKHRENNMRLVQEFSLLGEKNGLTDMDIEYMDTNKEESMYSDIIKFFGLLVIKQQLELESLRLASYRFDVPKCCDGKKLVIYGMDTWGRTLYHKLVKGNRYKEIIAVDKRWNYLAHYDIDIIMPELVDFGEIDYILIAVKNEKTYEAIKKYLLEEKKIEEMKILRISSQ